MRHPQRYVTQFYPPPIVTSVAKNNPLTARTLQRVTSVLGVRKANMISQIMPVSGNANHIDAKPAFSLLQGEGDFLYGHGDSYR